MGPQGGGALGDMAQGQISIAGSKGAQPEVGQQLGRMEWGSARPN
jgi:hypothetical protein